MDFSTDSENLKAESRPKIRIGSRVPDSNRGWLESHGIVSDQVVLKEKSQEKFSNAFFHIVFFLAGAAVCTLIAAGIYLYHERVGLQNLENFQISALEASNYHLRKSAEQQFAIGNFHQLEISRLNAELDAARAELEYKDQLLERQAALESEMGIVQDTAETDMTEVVVTAENSLSHLP